MLKDNTMEYKEVLGVELNNLCKHEIEVYLNGEEFNNEELYTVYENGDVNGANGSLMANEFVTEEQYSKLV